ncbi:hypothetical protein C1646_688440 [Rhizophagus diaphanus]|nr:hypothetical protein C1646_688440 [Rhizophagus diaphanus] [Rhizophagus sp. MUCL 43196]
MNISNSTFYFYKKTIISTRLIEIISAKFKSSNHLSYGHYLNYSFINYIVDVIRLVSCPSTFMIHQRALKL